MKLLPILLALAATALAIAAPDPTVYITASDTAAFAPAAGISRAGFPGKWYQRKVGFAGRGDFIFCLPAGGLYPDLTCAPQLRGKYNLYVNMREVNAVTGMQLKVSGRDLAWTVTPAEGTPTVHTNRDILVATEVAMDGQTVLLRQIGRLLYFSYLKFVPTEADTPGVAVDPLRVREEPLIDACSEWQRTREAVPEGRHELKHLSSAPAIPAPPDSRGYVLFSRPTLDLIFPDTEPEAGEIASELGINAALGEYEPVSFSARATRDLGLCKITVADLRSGGRVIAGKNLCVAVVSSRNLRTTFNGNEFMRVPTVLNAASTVVVPAGETRQVWLTLHVPADATPGQYQGLVTFAPQNAPATRLKLSVRVWPFALREPKDVACGMYDRLWAIEANDHWLRDRFADMRAHGLTTVAYCGGLNSEIALIDGKAQVQFDGNGGLEQGLDAYRDAGFTFPLMWMMSDDLWDWCSKQAPVGSEQFGTLYKQALQSILREVPKRRWPGLIFQPVDEPGSYEQRPIPGFLDRWAVESKLIHDAGGVVEIDHVPFTTEDPRLKDPLARALPFIDIFSQRFSNHNMWFTEDQWWWGNMKEQVGKWGKKLWSYNINDAAFFPELATYRLAFGHFLRREGVKGQLLWDFQDSAESPLNALDGSCTDMMYVYPSIPRAGEPGGPTLMWECMREGRDDYNYVYTLQCLTAEAEKQGRKALAAEGRDLLARLDASFDDVTLRARNRFLEGQWAETTTEPDGQRVARGEFNIPNGWRLADYDEWRTRVAKQIVRLQEGR